MQRLELPEGGGDGGLVIGLNAATNVLEGAELGRVTRGTLSVDSPDLSKLVTVFEKETSYGAARGSAWRVTLSELGRNSVWPLSIKVTNT